VLGGQERALVAHVATVCGVFDNEFGASVGGGGEEVAEAVDDVVGVGQFGGVAGRRWKQAARQAASAHWWRACVARAAALDAVVPADREGRAGWRREDSEVVSVTDALEQLCVEPVFPEVVGGVAVRGVVVNRCHVEAEVLEPCLQAVRARVRP
jgi:hypothetical protein